MNELTFKRESKKLFTDGYLMTINHECPEVIATQQLQRKFKALLKSLFPDCIIKAGGAYCECSGTVSKDATHSVYISISDFRYWENNLDDILIRTTDISGATRDGINNTTTLTKLKNDVYKLLDQEHKAHW